MHSWLTTRQYGKPVTGLHSAHQLWLDFRPLRVMRRADKEVFHGQYWTDKWNIRSHRVSRWLMALAPTLTSATFVPKSLPDALTRNSAYGIPHGHRGRVASRTPMPVLQSRF